MAEKKKGKKALKLEAAAEKFAHNQFNMHETNSFKELKRGFIAGVEWERKRRKEDKNKILPMAENTKIEWCDHTVNLWWGCTKVHAGCDNCYAEKWANRFGINVWGDNPRKASKSAFSDLKKYQKQAEKEDRTFTVFVGSMMDIFEKPKPLINHKGEDLGFDTGVLRQRLFTGIIKGEYPNLFFLFLTKRPSNINKYIPQTWRENPPLNVAFGASVVDKKSMLDVAKHMANVNGYKFWSIEPLLEGITLDDVKIQSPLDWVIVGGESGTNRRKFEIEWAERLHADCRLRGIAFFFKQIDKVSPIPQKIMIRDFPNFIKQLDEDWGY